MSWNIYLSGKKGAVVSELVDAIRIITLAIDKAEELDQDEITVSIYGSISGSEGGDYGANLSCNVSARVQLQIQEAAPVPTPIPNPEDERPFF